MLLSLLQKPVLMHNFSSRLFVTARMYWLPGLQYCLQALSNQDRDLASRRDQAIGGLLAPLAACEG